MDASQKVEGEAIASYVAFRTVAGIDPTMPTTDVQEPNQLFRTQIRQKDIMGRF